MIIPEDLDRSVSKNLKTILLKMKCRTYFYLLPGLREVARKTFLPKRMRFLLNEEFKRIMLGRDIRVFRNEVNVLENNLEEEVSPFCEKSPLVIDGQILTSPDLFRGIARYTLLFSVNLARRNPESKFLLLITNITGAKNKSYIEEYIKKEGISNLQIFTVDVFGKNSSITLTEASRKITNALKEKKAETVIIPTFFNEELSVIPFSIPFGTKTVGILHDLIPLQFEKEYLPTKKQKNKYEEQVKRLTTCDVILSVSFNSLEQLKKFTNYRGETAVIGGASILNDLSKEKNTFHQRKGIICVGGSGKSKNIYGLIKGTRKISSNLRCAHPLTIVGITNSKTRFSLKVLNMVLRTKVKVYGFISDEELAHFYKTNRILVVPSLAEGLSLPVFEMWKFGGIVVGGSGTTLSETIGTTSMLFDPVSFSDYPSLISELLLNENSWEMERCRILKELDRRNWDSVVGSAEGYLFAKEVD